MQETRKTTQFYQHMELLMITPRRLLFAFLTMALSGISFAGPGEGPGMPPMAGGGPFGGPGMHDPMDNPAPVMFDISEVESLMIQIGINKTTSAKVVTIARDFRTLFEEKLIKVQREELNIKEELLKDKPDLQIIKDCIGRKSQVFAEIEVAQIKRDLDIKSLLAPDEYERWKSAIRKKMRDMRPVPMEKDAHSQPMHRDSHK
jgi:hypothetical protein